MAAINARRLSPVEAAIACKYAQCNDRLPSKNSRHFRMLVARGHATMQSSFANQSALQRASPCVPAHRLSAIAHLSRHDKMVINYYLFRKAVVNSYPRNLPADERRAVTIESVVVLAATQNPSEITTAAIAKQMNLTQGALFRHFPSKEAIWQAVMEWVADRLLARIDRSVQGIESPVAAMSAMFISHVEFVVEHPGVPRMMFGELQRAESTPAKRMVQTLIQRYGERLHRLIEKGKAAGELFPELDNEAAATLFIGTIQGLVMQSLLAGDVERMRRDAPRVFAIYRRGIGSNP